MRDADPAEARATARRSTREIRERLGPGIYGIDGETFAGAVAKALRAQEATVALAESCTGGLTGELLTSEAGRVERSSGAA